jgi:HK97 family phage portal protein
MKIFGLRIEREAKTAAPMEPVMPIGRVTGGAAWAERLLGSSDPDVAAKISTVYQCVDLISSAIAVMPLCYKRLMDGVMRDYVKHDPDYLNFLLNVRPNRRLNGYDFKKLLVTWKLTLGNAFILPADGSGMALRSYDEPIVQLLLIRQDYVQYDVMRDEYTLCDPEQGIPQQTVPSRMIWHVKNVNFGSEGAYWGQSVLHYALQSVKMAATGNQEILKRVASGGRGKYILNYENAQTQFGAHKKDQMEGAADKLSSDLANGNDVVVLPYKGLTVSPIAMTSADLKLLETAQLSRQDLAGFFRVPLFMIGQQTSNYKTPDAANAALVNYCLAPHCVQIESELLSKYCGKEDWWKYSFDFDEDARMKLDVDMQSKKDMADLSAGIVTVNELRARKGRMPVDGGDEVYLSANLKGVKALQAEGEKALQPEGEKAAQNEPLNDVNDENTDVGGTEEGNQAGA